MKIWISFLLIALMLSLNSNAEKGRELPPVEEVDGDSASLEEAMPRMWVTGIFDVPEHLKHRLFSVSSTDTKNDLTQVEVNAVRELINDKTVPNSEKQIILGRYTMGDPRMTEVLIEAHKLGIEVVVLTDLNPVLDGKFEGKRAEEKFTVDFENAVYQGTDVEENVKVEGNEEEGGQSEGETKRKDAPGIKNLKALRDAGFEFNKNIISQPLYNPNKIKRVPIQHDKFLVLIRKKSSLVKGNIKAYFGTNNLAPNPRYNRLIEVVDAVMCKALLEYAQNLMDAFKRGGAIKDTAVLNLKKIKMKNGATAELGGTGGKINTNDRITNFIKENEDKLVEVILSHFVVTNREVVEAIREGLKKSVNARMTSITDDRFSEVDGWGLSIVLNGFDHVSPFGRNVYGFPTDVIKRVEAYIYSKPAFNSDGTRRVETDQEGPPEGVEVYHDKTTIIELVEKMVAVYTGSFNLSNNFHNSELQWQFNDKSDRELMQAFKISVKGFIEHKDNKEWVVPTIEQTYRNAIAMVTGHTDREIPRELVRKIIKAVVDRDLNTLVAAFQSLNSLPTHLKKKLKPEVRKQRIDTFIAFLRWYRGHVVQSSDTDEFRLRRVVGIAYILANPNANAAKKTEIVRGVIYRANTSKEELNKWVQEAANILDFKPAEFTPSPKEKSTTPATAESTPGNTQALMAVSPAEANLNKIIIFDWDDTIMRMPTKILLFTREKDEYGRRREFAISTEEFASEGKNIVAGKGKYAAYQILEETQYNSFKFFRNKGTANDQLSYFLDDIDFVIRNGDPKSWMAPYFWKFIEMLSNPESAKNAYILTARGHSAEEVLLGLKRLQEYMLKVHFVTIHLLPVANIITVNAADNTPERKGEEVVKIVESRGQSLMPIEVEVADDDRNNIKGIKAVYEAQLAAGKNLGPLNITHVTNEGNKTTTVGGKPKRPRTSKKLACLSLFAESA